VAFRAASKFPGLAAYSANKAALHTLTEIRLPRAQERNVELIAWLWDRSNKQNGSFFQATVLHGWLPNGEGLLLNFFSSGP